MLVGRQLQGGAGFAVAAGEGGGFDIALDEDQLALLDVLRGDFGQLAPAGDLPPGGVSPGFRRRRWSSGGWWRARSR